METFYEKMKIIENDENYLKETEEYQKFVREDLENVIKEFAYESFPMDIARACWSTLENLEITALNYMLIFLSKYNLIDIHTSLDSLVWCNPSDGLNTKMIIDAYTEELLKAKSNNRRPSIFERLDGYKTIEERQDHIKELSRNYKESFREAQYENAYNNFIIDKENGLYKLLEQALVDYDFRGFILVYNNWAVSYDFIKEFCDKYGIEVKMIERNNKVNKDLLINIKTIDDIRYLFQCFFGELQKIEHYSKSQNQLWQEQKEFSSLNREWIEKRKMFNFKSN